MEEFMVFDPYAYGALAVYLIGLGAITGGLAFVARAKQGAVLNALGAGLKSATHLGRAVFAALPGGKYLIYAGGHVSEVSGSGATELAPISRYAMVKDMDAQTGVVLTCGKTHHCVTGLGPMGRILAQLQREEKSLAFVFREDESKTIGRLLHSLESREQQILIEWLRRDDGEVLTDIVPEVDYEGSLGEGGAEKGKATLIVTNLRAGLLAQTVTRTPVSGGTQVTTRYHLVSYLLPAAEKVILERTPTLLETEYLLRLQLPAELAEMAQGTPVLKLGEEHAGILLPIALFNRPIEVLDGPPRGVVGQTLGGIGWGILLGLIMLGVAAFLSESGEFGSRHWWYRYYVPLIAGGFLTALVVRAAGLSQHSALRKGEQAVV
ncbi:MAG: hypothetical protein JKY65_27120 [Planctomycetes bacterium]|nr:hypothetical protein [Planctomycetota bacterium]